LILGLKRFDFDPYTGQPVKLLDYVAYPDVLSLKRPGDGGKLEYRLSAIVEHKGDSPAGGHYVCFVRKFDGAWTLFDDDRVQTISNEGHLNIQAYLLLYNRITS
jgi:ubiquitin carboxyl-terminal hydrolase 36/42